MTLSHTFSPRALGWLGGAFEDVSVVSPFSRFTDEAFTPEDKDRLVRVGVIDDEDQLSPDWLAALQSLADAQAFARMRLQSNNSMNAESIVYFGTQEHERVSISFVGEGMRVDYPPSTSDFLAEIVQYTGSSTMVNCDLECRLDYYEALLFVAAVDLNRLHQLRCLADEIERSYMTLDGEDLIEAAFSEGDRPQRITRILRAIPDRPGDIAPAEAREYLSSLCSTGLLQELDDGYQLSEVGRNLATSFAIVDQVMQIDCGWFTEDEEFSLAEAVFLQGGIHDILMVDPGAGQITLETFSGAMLEEYLDTLMSQVPRQ